MAAIANKTSTTLSIRVKSGIDENGKDVLKTLSLRNIKVDANEQNLFDVAEAFASVLKYPVNDILKQDVSTIINA